MSKITQYPLVGTLAENDLLLIANATDGTRTITPADLVREAKPLHNPLVTEITDCDEALNPNRLYKFGPNTSNAPFSGYGMIEVLNRNSNYVIQMAHKMNSANAVPYVRARYMSGEDNYVFGSWQQLMKARNDDNNTQINALRLYRNKSNATSYSFSYDRSGNSYEHFLVFGATAAESGFLFLGYIGSSSVTMIPIYNGKPSRTLTGSISSGTLTISSNDTIYGGITVLWMPTGTV